MNEPYKKIAETIRLNTITLRDNTIGMDVEAVEKEGLVEALGVYFQKTDALFNINEFMKACKEVT